MIQYGYEYIGVDMSPDVVESTLAEVLLELGYCATADEASAIVAVACDDGEASWTASLAEQLDVSQQEVDSILQRYRELTGEEDKTESDDHDNPEPLDADESDGEYIGEGECELCEREIRLTKHHLIPKSTWSRIEVRLRHALAADTLAAAESLAGSLSPLFGHIQEGVPIKRVLGWYTANLCRPCHSMIHRRYSNMELALEYNSIDRLLQDDGVRGYAKWAHKQRSGRFSTQHGATGR